MSGAFPSLRLLTTTWEFLQHAFFVLLLSAAATHGANLIDVGNLQVVWPSNFPDVQAVMFPCSNTLLIG